MMREAEQPDTAYKSLADLTQAGGGKPPFVRASRLRAKYDAELEAGLTFTGAALVTAYAGAEDNGGGAAGGGANGASMLGQLALIGYAFFFSLQRVRTLASSLMFNAYTVISAANAQPFTALQMPFAALWSLLLIKEPI
eukprot:jgi/Chrpa1/25428/Chrysochromulina_OHIO_Genome00023205-RA